MSPQDFHTKALYLARNLISQPFFTLLHRKAFALEAFQKHRQVFCTKRLRRQNTFRPHILFPRVLYTTKLLYQKPLPPEIFYTSTLVHRDSAKFLLQKSCKHKDVWGYIQSQNRAASQILWEFTPHVKVFRARQAFVFAFLIHGCMVPNQELDAISLASDPGARLLHQTALLRHRKARAVGLAGDLETFLHQRGAEGGMWVWTGVEWTNGTPRNARQGIQGARSEGIPATPPGFGGSLGDLKNPRFVVSFLAFLSVTSSTSLVLLLMKLITLGSPNNQRQQNNRDKSQWSIIGAVVGMFCRCHLRIFDIIVVVWGFFLRSHDWNKCLQTISRGHSKLVTLLRGDTTGTDLCKFFWRQHLRNYSCSCW